jgi:hypothetical protein
VRSAVSALAIVAAAAYFGGWHFAVIAALALALLLLRDVWESSAVSMLWLALYFASGDPRLFFPFSIQFALQCGWPRGAAVLASFLAIRISQGATAKVLLVELAVAVVVIAISLGGYARSSRTLLARAGWAAAGSFLAYLGLAF